MNLGLFCFSGVVVVALERIGACRKAQEVQEVQEVTCGFWTRNGGCRPAKRAGRGVRTIAESAENR